MATIVNTSTGKKLNKWTVRRTLDEFERLEKQLHAMFLDEQISVPLIRMPLNEAGGHLHGKSSSMGFIAGSSTPMIASSSPKKRSLNGSSLRTVIEKKSSCQEFLTLVLNDRNLSGLAAVLVFLQVTFTNGEVNIVANYENEMNSWLAMRVECSSAPPLPSFFAHRRSHSRDSLLSTSWPSFGSSSSSTNLMESTTTSTTTSLHHYQSIVGRRRRQSESQSTQFTWVNLFVVLKENYLHCFETDLRNKGVLKSVRSLPMFRTIITEVGESNEERNIFNEKSHVFKVQVPDSSAGAIHRSQTTFYFSVLEEHKSAQQLKKQWISVLKHASSRNMIHWDRLLSSGSNKHSSIHMAGWLTKLGERVHNWKRRFFILDRTSVSYFKNEGAIAPLGEFCVSGCSVRLLSDRVSSSTIQKTNVICVDTYV